MDILSRQHFWKMHGAGNDFVVLDLRNSNDKPDPELCKKLADRQTGVGCDLILGIEEPVSSEAVASYKIWTAEGLPSMQCGNGARCVAKWLFRYQQIPSKEFVLESPSGKVDVTIEDTGQIQISLPAPDFATTQDFVQELDLKSLNLNLPGTYRYFCASTGNPHVVLEVDAIEIAEVKAIGDAIQRSPHFPNSACVGFAQRVSNQELALRVFEFGAGETLACGTGACAAAAGFMQQGRLDRRATVSLLGGDLSVSWSKGDEKIYLAGPAEFVFEGELENAHVQQHSGDDW